MFAFPRQASAVVGAVLVCTFLSAKPVSSEKDKKSVSLDAPTWSVDLRQYGYRPRTGIDLRLSEMRVHTFDWFLSDNRLIVTFLSRETVEGLQRRTDTHQEFPYALHAVVLDASSGQFLKQARWGSDYPAIGLIPRSDGSFAIFLGDRMDFYSADLEPRKELKLSEVHDEGDVIWFSRSPTGKTVLVQYRRASGAIACVWVTGDAISNDVEACDLPEKAVISDEEVVGSSSEGLLRVRGSEGRWRPLCSECYFPQFVTEDTILVWGRMDVGVIRGDRRTVFWSGLGFGGSLGMWVHFYAPKTGLLALPFHGRSGRNGMAGIRVYNIPTRKQIFEVNNEVKDEIVSLQGVAISPASGWLAVQGDGIVRCFRLPAPK